MTNKEKLELKTMVKLGFTYKQIRKLVTCSDKTIRKYMNTFGDKKRKWT